MNIMFLITLLITMFGLMQNSSGAMETQVRLGILFFLICMYFLNNELIGRKDTKINFLLIIIFIVLSINFFGTLYSFAGIPMVFIAILINWFIQRKIQLRKIIIMATYVISVFIYTKEYSLFTASGMQSQSLTSGIKNIFIHPIKFIEGFFSYCANGVLGWAYYQNKNFNMACWFIVGISVAIIIFYALGLYFYKKMYLESYFPLFMIVYGIGVYVLVYIGRECNWQWFAGEWYITHIRIMLAGTVIILYNSYSNIKEHKLVSRLAILLGVTILFFSIYGNVLHVQRSPFVRSYYIEKQKSFYLLENEEMPVDTNGYTPLLQNLKFTQNAIKFLKDNTLSIYKYGPNFDKIKINSIAYGTAGYYPDRWCLAQSSIFIDSNKNQNISVKFTSIQESGKIDFYMNGSFYKTIDVTKDQDTSIDLILPKNAVTNIRMIADFDKQLSDIDTRKGSFQILDIN